MTIPLCHFHSFSDVLAFCSHCLWDLALDHTPTWTTVKFVVFCTLSFVTDVAFAFNLTNQCPKSFLHPTSSQNQLPGDMTMHVSPLTLVSSATQRELAHARYFLSILHTPTSSNWSILLVSRAFPSRLFGERFSYPLEFCSTQRLECAIVAT